MIKKYIIQKQKQNIQNTDIQFIASYKGVNSPFNDAT